MYKRYRQEWTKHLDFIVIEEIARLDTQYITDWTISMDIKLILKTMWMVVAGDEGAM